MGLERHRSSVLAFFIQLDRVTNDPLFGKVLEFSFAHP